MASSDPKVAAQKELLRRKAAAELARRRGQDTAQATPSSRPDTWGDTLFRLTPMGMAKDVYSAAQDPMGSLQKIDDSARMLANGATFGFADKFAGYMGGTGTKAERERSKRAKERLGTTGDALEIMGSVIPATKLAQAGITAANIPGWVGKYGGLILDGAAYGALDAAGHDKPIAQGAGIGGLFGAAGQVVKSGAEKGYSLLQGKAPVPSIDDLQKAKTAAYGAVDNAGIKFAPTQVDDLVSGIADELSAAKINPMRHPKAASMLAEIQGMGGKEMSLTDLDQLRQVISRDVASSPDAAERFFGKKMIDNIDEFISANGGGELMEAARAANSRFRKTEAINEALTKAERRAASTGSGGNVDNATRQNIRGLLDSVKKSRFYTPEEKRAMETVVRGTKGQNALRLAGKLSPQGNGLMAALGIGGTMVNPLFGIPALLGTGAKMAADTATKGNIDDLLRIVGGVQSQTKTMTPAQKKALESMVRAGTVGLLGAAAQ